MNSRIIFNSLITALLTIPLFNACCGTVDCDVSDNSVNIRILSKVDSTDLFFGQDPKYQVEQTNFFGLSNGDTIYLEQTIIDYFQDTILHVDFGFDLDSAYVQFEDGDIDTFSLFRSTSDSKCCGTSIKLDELTFNDMIRMENTYPYVVLLK